MAKNITIKSKQPFSNYFCGKRVRNSIYFNPTDEYEIIGIISSLNPNKASGVDDIPTKLIIAAKYILALYLTEIINSFLAKGQYLKLLALYLYIYKGGSKNEPKNYRPISILTSFNKIFETIFKRRLMGFWNKYNVFSPTQFGSRESFSTTLAITHFRECILNELDSNMNICAVFMDLAKAFDTVNHDILLFKLEQYGIRGVANDLLKSYLSNRKQLVSGDVASSSLLEIDIGVPQGSVLGPILFLIYINDLSHCSNLNSTLYADDSVLMLSHKNVNILKSIMEMELSKLNIWLSSNQLSLNLSKTKFMLFTKSSQNIAIQIDGCDLMHSHCVKYLGVYLDDKLNWYKHIQHLETKLSAATGAIYRLRKYLPYFVLIPVYYNLVYSHLQHAIICWGSTYKSYLQKVQVKQNRIAKILSNKFGKKTSLKPLFKKLKLLKLDEIYSLEVAKFMAKIHFNKLLEFCGDCLKNFMKLSSIHTYSTRSALSNNYHVPQTNYCKTDQSLKVSGAKIWNNLPIT